MNILEEKIMVDNIMNVPVNAARSHNFPAGDVTQETLMNELGLLQLGMFEPLYFYVDPEGYRHDIQLFKNDWVEYLPKEGRPNNRQGLAVTNLPGKTHQDNPSLPQAKISAGRELDDEDFNQPTDVYRDCESLQPICDAFEPLGRTFIVRSGIGGYFPPHRDHPSIPRRCFRIIVFLQNCGPLQYDWWMGDKKLQIEHGRAYYVNTRMTHRTISWIDESDHMIMNIPMTTKNVEKVVANLLHTH
tara:strand:- start:47 stop:778 length:732 start_codon:yes stop_codon:yes gene_type:complete